MKNLKKTTHQISTVANKALDWIGLGDIAQCRNEGLAKFNQLLASDPLLAARCAATCANKNYDSCKTIGKYAYYQLLDSSTEGAADFLEACLPENTDQCYWAGIGAFKYLAQKNAPAAEKIAINCAGSKDKGCEQLGFKALESLASSGKGVTFALKCLKKDTPQCISAVRYADCAGFGSMELDAIKQACANSKSEQCQSLLSGWWKFWRCYFW